MFHIMKHSSGFYSFKLKQTRFWTTTFKKTDLHCVTTPTKATQQMQIDQQSLRV